jgi:hypothetical protein
MNKSNLTLVTALYDLGRGEMGTSFSRSFDHYKECFSRLLKLDFNLVIYCDSSLNEFVWQYRKHENTRIVNKTVADLKAFPFYKEIQQMRTNPDWYNRAGWLSESTQARLELYNPVVMSKQFMLNDSSLFNYFDTNYFLWIDAGISNTVSIERYMDDTFEKRITKHMNKMLYLCFPYDGTVEVHGFEKQKLNEMAGKETTWVARGGMFGGTKHIINELNDIYYNLLQDSLRQGYMGTEESIHTIITYKHKDKCNIRMIEGNGLIVKFFEDLQNEKVTSVNSTQLALYCLTYNLPEQFHYWVKSIKETLRDDYGNYKKYVVDNSDDPKVFDQYKLLFQEYDFEVLAKETPGNVGINGGRYEVAKHFDKSEHEYMIFFEDDMLLCDKSYENRACKSGFIRWVPNLFDKAIGIFEYESLNALKLSFSEFFGDGHNNWAYFNLPEVDRVKLFPEREDGVDKKKTKLDYTGTYKGVPYIIGEHHYCNWPILLSKEGNKKIFLDVVWEHPFEQTWMSYFFRDLIKQNKFKMGTLLCSPINHDRKFFYDKRKENKH